MRWFLEKLTVGLVLVVILLVILGITNAEWPAFIVLPIIFGIGYYSGEIMDAIRSVWRRRTGRS